MARKYKVIARCQRCKTAQVGTLESDHPYFEGRTDYVDAFHVCNDCAPSAAAAAEAQQQAELDRQKAEQLERMAKMFDMTPEQFQKAMKKIAATVK